MTKNPTHIRKISLSYSRLVNDRKVFLSSLIIAIAGMLFSGPAGAQIYEVNYNGGSATVGSYTAAGATTNSDLVNLQASSEGGIVVSNGDLFIADYGDNIINEFTTSGVAVNTSLISGLDGPAGLALDNAGNLYEANLKNGTVGKYTTSGATVNSDFISFSGAFGLALAGNDLYVGNISSGTIGEYNATTGAAINSSLITGLSSPVGIAVDGAGDLFVSNSGTGTIGVYNATSGAAINASLISGLSDAYGIALDGLGNLLVENTPGTTGSISEYTTSGTLENADFITGLSVPIGLTVVETVPEPSTIAMLFGSIIFLIWFQRSRFRNASNLSKH